MGNLDPVTFGGKTVDRRTASMLREAQRLSNLEDPKIGRFSLTQGSWSHAETSAGTHAGPGAFDMYTAGYSEHQKQVIGMALRTVGFASWRRRELPGKWEEHWHGIAIGTHGLPPLAQSQVTSYRQGRNGLKGNGPDTDPRPQQTVTWEQYKQLHGAEMQGLGSPAGNGDQHAVDATGHAGVVDPYGIGAGAQIGHDMDSDHDGLMDAFEKLAGTSAALADTDADSLPDAYEALYSHTDPLSGDTDGDGVTDPAELAAGTDAGRLPGIAGVVGTGIFAENVRHGIKDGDQDGLSDRTERLLGTNAKLADTDADELSDAEEMSLGTNPLDVDSDRDGLSDGLEISYQSDPLSNVQDAPWRQGLSGPIGGQPDPGGLDPAGSNHLDGAGALDLN
jgi:thrombospondin type 3 repeat protein